MVDRQRGLSITFGDIGRGTVVRNVPPETLASPTPNNVLSPAASPGTTNVALFEGLARRRDGYDTYSTVASNAQINGAFVAAFDPVRRYLVRGYASTTGAGGAVQRYNEPLATWITISPAAGAGRGVLAQPWAFAMTPNAAPSPSNVLIFGNQGSDIYTWDGQGAANSGRILTDTAAPSGPKALASFLSRAFAFNVMDENGDRKSSQLAYSAVGDSRDWSSLGSGAVEINDDPYPGVAMLGIGGRLALFKGGIDGGAVYIATPTGVSSAPIRIDAINPETSIGPVVPRSVIPLSSTTAFFLGHDAAYIYDGVRALLPFAEGVARDITSRLNPAAIDTGFAIYKRATREVELHVATGVATTPNEIWIFDTRQRRAYGPYTYADSMLCATTWQEQGALSWDTWGQAAGRTWDTLTDAGGTEYHQWDLAKGDTGSDLTIYGGADGQLYQNNTTFTDDDGTAIACTYLCPPVTPMDWTSARGGSPQQGSRRWRPDDIMVLREVHIRHRSTTQWTPVVEVSTDGSAFSAVSDGTAVAATGGRLLTKSYYVDSSLSAPGTWHQARVKNTSGDELAVRDITLVFTYAGGGRHE